MKKKTIFLLIHIILIVLAIISLPLTFIIHSIFFAPPPSYATYGEFPITLTYEINGETVTTNEIYVVECNGYNPMLGYTYSGRIQSTGEQGIILYQENNYKIICEFGTPDYYIGKTSGYENNIVPPHYYIQEEKRTFLFFKEKTFTVLTENELYEQYSIRLVSWTTAEPLETLTK